ncbi:MAG TPA: hypothetical protein VFB14_13465 [Bryobacteraceae bacterium]|nr:hypothetical protein [Bryobacteraceae bacterium]
MLRVFKNNMVARPSTIECRNYPDISKAYSQTVHAVLMGNVPAAKAAAGLEKQLVQITHLKGQAN